MRQLTQRFALLLMLFFAGVSICNAQNDPRWIKESEKKLNTGVSNNSYSISVLRGHSPSERQILPERKRALAKYVTSQLDAIETSVRVDSVSGGEQPVFWVYYNTDNSENNFVVAKLIDQHSKYTDDILNVYEYEFFYLFAISKPDTYPQYDEFINYKPSNAKALALSLIPGLGQIYKGHDKKGYAILGGEIMFAGAALIFNHKHNYCENQVGVESDISGPSNWESWHSKARTWAAWRTGAIGCLAGLYVYNLIDAATAQGCGNFKIKKVVRDHLVIGPYLDSEHSGISMRVTF